MMIAEEPGDIEDDDEEGALGLEDIGEVEKLSYLCKIPLFYRWASGS